MTTPPPSALYGPIQLAISSTNLPFRLIAYISSPLTRTGQRTWHLLCQVHKQNWIFLCIFYLHLWQLFKDLPPIRPLARHWTQIVATLLFLGCGAPAVLILHASIPPLRAYWADAEPKRHAEILQRIALFVMLCAPACAMMSVLVTVAGFVRKQAKHGKFRASMRKLGRGYWADPRDLEDWRKVGSRAEAVERLRAWEGWRRRALLLRGCVGGVRV